MRTTERNILLPVLLSLSAGALWTPRAGAQDHSDSRHVLLAVSSDTLGPTHVAIVRRPGAQVVVMVSAQATPEDLLSAIGTIGLLRARNDTTVTQATTISPVVHFKSSPQQARDETRMEILLERLRYAPTTRLDGVGNVAALEIDLGPAPCLRASP